MDALLKDNLHAPTTSKTSLHLSGNVLLFHLVATFLAQLMIGPSIMCVVACVPELAAPFVLCCSCLVSRLISRWLRLQMPCLNLCSGRRSGPAPQHLRVSATHPATRTQPQPAQRPTARHLLT